MSEISNIARDEPVRATSLSALNLDEMPTSAHFRRDHFFAPEIHGDWRLEVGGSVRQRLELRYDVLRSCPSRELTVALECAGHRRAEFRTATSGVKWGVGAVSEARWAGTSLRHILERAGLTGSPRCVVLEGADEGLFRDTGTVRFARALPIRKALHPDTLLAWNMNGEPIPVGHGAPVRAIVPGWYATDSVKWLNRILVLEEPFMGLFEALDYRLTTNSAVPGMRLTALPVHSLLTSVHDGERISEGPRVLRGIAWGGDAGVSHVELSIDDRKWQRATLIRPKSRYAFVRWEFRWLARGGLHGIAVRATDAAGKGQPSEPQWNHGGYANSSIQRVRIHVC